MSGYLRSFENRAFSRERIELDGASYTGCSFTECIFVLETGDAALSRCTFEKCQLVLRGNAYTVAQIIRLFTKDGPVKVLDLE
jgi:hypothetical protein